MKFVHFFLFPLFIFITLLVISCGTSQPALRFPDTPLQEQTADSITVSVEFVNEDTLTEKYGTINNPFVSPPSALGLNRIIIFEVVVENNAPDKTDPARTVIIQLNKIELQFSGKNKIQPTDFISLISGKIE